MNHFKKYIILIGSLILFIGYFLINIGTTNEDSIEITLSKISQSSNLSVIKSDSTSENNHLILTKNDGKSTISLPENKRGATLEKSLSKIEFNILEQVDHVSSLD
jgi:hypothetical protein